jgi:protein translocase SecG subunit
LILAAAAAAASAKPQIQFTTVPNPNATPVTLQAPPPAPMQLTWFQAHASWATHTVAAIFVIAAVALVVLLAVQTTKQEGLSGTIGGRVESAYSRMGAEEQLKRITGFTAVVFVLTAFILSLTGI